MGYKENEELSKFDAIKLLLERSQVEAQLFWVRNNFLFVTNTALLGAAFYYFFINVPAKAPSEEIKTAISIAGLYVSFMWFSFNKVGRRLNHAYLQDAKNIAQEDEFLVKIFSNSLGDKSSSEAVDKKHKPLIEKIENYYSATLINYIFILGFVVGWVYVLTKPITKS